MTIMLLIVLTICSLSFGINAGTLVQECLDAVAKIERTK